MMYTIEEKSEIAFFDVETTVPKRPGQKFAILEFGAILVCPRKLVELHSYSTLVCPANLSLISSLSVRCNGITKDAVVSAPSFADIADVVYEILHGRIWAGHNILKFDCARIKEAFSDINRPPPEPKGTIDSLALLTQRFGRRAGDMKMATLASYFGLGTQTHRSLDDVRMNLEVIKYCATVLFLESSLPDIFPENSWMSRTPITNSRGKENSSVERRGENESESSVGTSFSVPCKVEENHPVLSFQTTNSDESDHCLVEDNMERHDPFNMVALCNEVNNNPLPEEEEEEETVSPSQESRIPTFPESSDESSNFLEPDNIAIPSLTAIFTPFYRGTQKIQVLHDNLPLLLCNKCVKLRFGVSTKFVDNVGRPRLSIVVNAMPSLCNILDAVDSLAQNLFMDSGGLSEWRPLVIRKPGYYNFPTVRLHLPTVTNGEGIQCAIEIHQKDASSMKKMVFDSPDIVKLDSIFRPGIIVDAYFSMDSYDYQQIAGLRLVAKKLIVHSE